MSEELSGVDFEVEYLPIRVNEKILLEIGGGIYSSVAGAIKELVNNAFDADAEQVVISTGYPYFDEIQVLDTGHGMSLERFKMAMVSIGNSMKDTIDPSRVTSKHKRPIIGRLGIGLMALSQICDKAIIESQEPGAKTKFTALINFSQLRRNRYTRTGLSVLSSQYGGAKAIRHQLEQDELAPERREELKLRLKLALEADKVRQMKEVDLEKTHLGYCAFMPELPALPYVQGTTVTLLGIRPEIRRALTGEERPTGPLKGLDWEEYLSEVDDWSWPELRKRLQTETDGLTYQALPSYHQFLYELALMSPVPYEDDAPISIRPDILQEKKRALKGFKFSVIVDNRDLYKPQLLPSASLAKEDEPLKEGEDYIIHQIHFNDDIDGSQLRYEGYLYWQRTENKPSALRGIQLYIRNAGIGLYDQTLLNFSKVNSTLQVGQLSGEIYVERGLERALKLDRQSFRETDPHYVVLQYHIWKELDSILEKSIQANARRQKAKSATELKQHVADLEQLVSSATNGKLDLTVTANDAVEPIEVNEKKLVFNVESKKWAGTESEQLLGQKILLTTKAAVAAGASTQDVLQLLEGIVLNSNQ